MAVCNVESFPPPPTPPPTSVESELKGFVSSGDLCLWGMKKGVQGFYLKVLVLPVGVMLYLGEVWPRAGEPVGRVSDQ